MQTGCPDGSNPQALILAPDGNFYGPTSGGGANNGTGTVFKITSTGGLTTLYTFTGTDGAALNGPLLLDTNGTTATASSSASPPGWDHSSRPSPRLARRRRR